MEYFDKKAMDILTKTYWKNGWTYVEPSAEELAYAREKGVMFEEETVLHDDMIPRILKARERVSAEKCAAAFLCSLSTRQLYLRSAIVSKLSADTIKQHKFIPYGTRNDLPKFKWYCSGCRDCGHSFVGTESRELDVYSFERIKFGGVSLAEPYYSMFDLENFPAEGEFSPTEEDIKIFKNIISIAESCKPNDAATQLCQKLTGVFRSNKNERSTVIEILGFLGILKAAHERSDRGSKNDWVSVYHWRGEDGVNRAMLNKWFGKYI